MITATSQLLLTRFLPNFKDRFLGLTLITTTKQQNTTTKLATTTRPRTIITTKQLSWVVTQLNLI